MNACVAAAFPLSSLASLTCLSAQRTRAAGPSEAGLGRDWQASATQTVLTHGGQVDAASEHGLSATFAFRPADVAHTERALRCGLALLDLARPRRWA